MFSIPSMLHIFHLYYDFLDFAENKKENKLMWVGLKAKDDDTVCNSAASCKGKLTNHGPAEAYWTFEGGDFLSEHPVSIDSKNAGRCVAMTVPYGTYNTIGDPDGDNYKLSSVLCDEKRVFVCNTPCPTGE